MSLNKGQPAANPAVTTTAPPTAAPATAPAGRQPASGTAPKTAALPATAPNKTATSKPAAIPGLKITDLKVGSGAVAVAGMTVSVNYTGKLTNGTVFDSSLNPGRKPIDFTLGTGQVIKGWDLGVAGMKVGGKRKLTIAPDTRLWERRTPSRHSTQFHVGF